MKRKDLVSSPSSSRIIHRTTNVARHARHARHAYKLRVQRREQSGHTRFSAHAVYPPVPSEPSIDSPPPPSSSSRPPVRRHRRRLILHGAALFHTLQIFFSPSSHMHTHTRSSPRSLCFTLALSSSLPLPNSGNERRPYVYVIVAHVFQ